MGLHSIISKVKKKEKEMRILILGLDNAGKTTVINYLNGSDVRTVHPTLGFEIKSLDYQGYKLNIWDVGGQQTIRAYWRNYFEKTDGLVWVIDSSDTDRLDLCRKELEGLLQEERLAGATLLILANKQDLENALSVEEIADKLELCKSIGRKRHWKLFPCSALSADGVKVRDNLNAGFVFGFKWLIADIASRVFLL